MEPVTKFFYSILAILVVCSFFVPIVTNPHPTDCNNYLDGAGGYYLKCKDEYITLYKKLTLPKGTVETKPRTF